MFNKLFIISLPVACSGAAFLGIVVYLAVVQVCCSCRWYVVHILFHNNPSPSRCTCSAQLPHAAQPNDGSTIPPTQCFGIIEKRFLEEKKMS
jgi:hypothetical protein